jgi:uncharacterized protein GlcG (DUF336 family)
MRAISLDEAVKIINETFAEAKRRNAYPLTAVLLDAGGRMKCAMKQDGASLLRFEVSYGKAYAALAMGRESRQVLQKAKDKRSCSRSSSSPMARCSWRAAGNSFATARAR